MERFDKDVCDFVEDNYFHIEMYPSMITNIDVDGQIIDPNQEADILININDMHAAHHHQHDNFTTSSLFELASGNNAMDYSTFDDWTVAEFEQSSNNLFNSTTFFPVTPAPNYSSTSLPTTPVKTKSKRKSLRNCCKAIKFWITNKPKTFISTAQELFPEYTDEIKDALKMKAPRSGRPLKDEDLAKLSPEKRKQYRNIYDVNKECKKFIASFVRRYNSGYAATMKLGDFEYPMNIERRPKKLLKSSRSTL